MENTLYYGDNLDVMRRHIKDETVDLVYLDPPFNSDQNYNVLFKEQNGTRAASQIHAFEDSWIWNQESETIYGNLVTAGGRVSDCLQSFRTFLGECDMLAYLVMMAPRLMELLRILKSTGSIYLHCDPTASHYLKMLMDAVFGARNFRNEIVWCYSIGGRSSKTFGCKHDVIFWYSKGNTWTFNPDAPEVRVSRKPDSHMKVITDEKGVTWQEKKDSKTGKIYRYPFDKVANDYWLNIEQLNREEAERLGYPTQKPQILLERIVAASSNKNDIVFDPFCGCGTTIAAAQKLGRSWIGIDITHLAISLIKRRLKDSFGIDPIVCAVSTKKSEVLKAAEVLGEYGELTKKPFYVVGEPTSLPDAQVLAGQDKYQFQWWALGLVGARPADQKKGADRGIDGKIIFHGEKIEDFESVIISVKGGETIVPAFVRDLKGVLDREKAAIGVLITMQEPTANMKTEAATAGFYESASWGRKYPRVQLLTIAELLAGKKIEMPPLPYVDATLKKAPRVAIKQKEQQELQIKRKEKE